MSQPVESYRLAQQQKQIEVMVHVLMQTHQTLLELQHHMGRDFRHKALFSRILAAIPPEHLVRLSSASFKEKSNGKK